MCQNALRGDILYENGLRATIVPRVYKFVSITSLVFCVAHLVFFVIFHYERAWLLSLYELFSFIFYVITLFVFPKVNTNLKKLSVLLSLMITELTLHVSLALITVGKEFEFQHYIYGILIFIMFENYINNNIVKTSGLVVFAICGLAFPYMYVRTHAPVYECDEALIRVGAIANPIAVMFLTVCYVFLFWSIISEFEKKLVYQATHDVLTGMNNRTLLSNLQYTPDTWVAILDIDDFKKINDTYGHDIGDDVLKDLSMQLMIAARQMQGLHTIRWGGEEFVLICSHAQQSFLDLAEELLHEIRRASIPVGSREISYHVTIGVADASDGADLEELIKEADKRLYEGKQTGKNKVVYRQKAER